MKYIATIDDQEYLVDILDENRVQVGEQVYQVDFQWVNDQPVYSLIIDGKSFEAYVFPEEDVFDVLLLGHMFPVRVEDERDRRLRAAAGKVFSESEEYHLKAPMPGLVISVLVTEGQVVQKGDVLVILESMKMQNELRSPRPGVVQRLRVRPGDRVEQRQTMLRVV
jgi:acetyl/propionyl-CoA carboxylase alpha subunit